jgi:Reverse transcriptase (RNA-dependent DNA polymerase)
MPFGLSNSPATFQAFVTSIFSDMIDRKILVHINDILAYSNSKEDHNKFMVEIFTRLKANKFYMNEEKSIFNASKNYFLGYGIEKGLVRPEIEKKEFLLKWPTPEILKTRRNFSDSQITTVDS